ncbi:Extracellular sulfatase Sulf-1, partial [Frankliniella fusca]
MSLAWSCSQNGPSTSVASTSTLATEAAERVPLDDTGITISKVALDKLQYEVKSSDWATTLLYGVFGDKAPYMRIKRQKLSKENIMLFREYNVNFKTVAGSLLRKWMKARTVYNDEGQLVPKYTENQIEAKVDKVLTKLADQSDVLRLSLENQQNPKKKKPSKPDDVTRAKRSYKSWEDNFQLQQPQRAGVLQQQPLQPQNHQPQNHQPQNQNLQQQHQQQLYQQQPLQPHQQQLLQPHPFPHPQSHPLNPNVHPHPQSAPLPHPISDWSNAEGLLTN